MLRTPSGKIELAPPSRSSPTSARLRAALDAPRDDGGLVLIGRRQLRSNNSWMHNLELLVSGPERCTLHVHPDDAARLGLADGEPARVRSRAGEIEAPVEVTDAVMPRRRLAPARLGPRRARARGSRSRASTPARTRTRSPTSGSSTRSPATPC